MMGKNAAAIPARITSADLGIMSVSVRGGVPSELESLRAKYVLPGVLRHEFRNGSLIERMEYDMRDITGLTVGNVVDSIGSALKTVAAEQGKDYFLLDANLEMATDGGHFVRQHDGHHVAYLIYGKVEMIANTKGYIGMHIEGLPQNAETETDCTEFMRAVLRAVRRPSAQ